MLEKMFNGISIWIGLVGGFLANFLGGYDMLLKTIIALVVLDYLTGILKAIYTKQLSSAVGYKGIVKKVMLFVVIAVACVLQNAVGQAIPLREITIMFFIANEGISLLENASEIIPIPERLKDILIQLREKSDKDESEVE